MCKAPMDHSGLLLKLGIAGFLALPVLISTCQPLSMIGSPTKLHWNGGWLAARSGLVAIGGRLNIMKYT